MPPSHLATQAMAMANVEDSRGRKKWRHVATSGRAAAKGCRQPGDTFTLRSQGKLATKGANSVVPPSRRWVPSRRCAMRRWMRMARSARRGACAQVEDVGRGESGFGLRLLLDLRDLRLGCSWPLSTEICDDSSRLRLVRVGLGARALACRPSGLLVVSTLSGEEHDRQCACLDALPSREQLATSEPNIQRARSRVDKRNFNAIGTLPHPDDKREKRGERRETPKQNLRCCDLDVR